jgi:BMFP domain-containing protein YqiC
MAAKKKRRPAKRREPAFVRPGEIDDLALLPKRFDLFVGEVRDSFRLLSDRILPLLERLQQDVGDHKHLLAAHTRELGNHDQRLTALEARTTDTKGPGT